MGHFHFEVKAGSRSKGACASLKFEYLFRLGKFSYRTDLEYSESGNMPEWAMANPHEMWRAADLYEGANRTLFREMNLALPKESTAEERKSLLQKFIEENLKGFPYSSAIHNPVDYDLNMNNPHLHIEFSDRKLDGIDRDEEQFFKRANKGSPEKGGCQKALEWGGKDRDQHLHKLRKSWADILNEFYKLRGIEIRVDHRSLADQRAEAIADGDLKKAAELDREPDRRINTRRYRILQRTGQLMAIKELRLANREAAKAKAEIIGLQQERQMNHHQQQKENEIKEANTRHITKSYNEIRQPTSEKIVVNGKDLHNLLKSHYFEQYNLALQWEQKAQNLYRNTPFTTEQIENDVKNELLNQSYTYTTVDSIERRHQKLIQEKIRMDKYYHQKFDVSDKSGKTENAKLWIKTQLAIPFSILNKELKQFEKWKSDFNDRVHQHNKQRNIYNSPEAKIFIINEVENRMHKEAIRIEKYKKCIENQIYHERQCQQLKPYKKCFDDRASKHFLTEKFIVLGPDIESILSSKNLLQHLQHQLDIAKRLERKRSKEQGLSR